MAVRETADSDDCHIMRERGGTTLYLPAFRLYGGKGKRRRSKTDEEIHSKKISLYDRIAGNHVGICVCGHTAAAGRLSDILYLQSAAADGRGG